LNFFSALYNRRVVVISDSHQHTKIFVFLPEILASFERLGEVDEMPGWDTLILVVFVHFVWFERFCLIRYFLVSKFPEAI
jgi:hypothetical protein